MTSQTINLETFCSPERPELARPFSLGEWTYASNGHVLVRVQRREEIPENAENPVGFRAASLFSEITRKPHYTPAPKFELPEALEKKVRCFPCDGSGKAHRRQCPDCQCECPVCHGTGERIEPAEPIKIGRTSFTAKYISWLQQLPNLELDRVPRGPNPMRFRFDGGEGLLMPCRA